jgi:hypothetical protein
VTGAVLEARGAPVDQGRAQGETLRARVREALVRLRRRYALLGFRAARARARREPARALERFLPWQSERVDGLAQGAGVAASALHVAERVARVRGIASACGDRLYLSFDAAPELEDLLLLRASLPDAGGFASVELTCAPWASCLGGINSEGIAVLCPDDRASLGPSTRVLAQELLFRARDLDAGIEHLRRRARYVGASGALLAAAPGAPARWLRFEDGALTQAPAAGAPPPAGPTLELDRAARRLAWIRPSGEPVSSQAPAPPNAAG